MGLLDQLVARGDIPSVANAQRMAQGDMAHPMADPSVFTRGSGFNQQGFKRLLELIALKQKQQAQMAARNAGPAAVMRG